MSLLVWIGLVYVWSAQYALTSLSKQHIGYSICISNMSYNTEVSTSEGACIIYASGPRYRGNQYKLIQLKASYKKTQCSLPARALSTRYHSSIGTIYTFWTVYTVFHLRDPSALLRTLPIQCVLWSLKKTCFTFLYLTRSFPCSGHGFDRHSLIPLKDNCTAFPAV